ncbi:hypothetical protein [Deinococcus sp. UYEF24]
MARTEVGGAGEPDRSVLRNAQAAPEVRKQSATSGREPASPAPPADLPRTVVQLP